MNIYQIILLLFAVIALALFVIPTQHKRPSYRAMKMQVYRPPTLVERLAAPFISAMVLINTARHSFRWERTPQLRAANIAEGVHDGATTRLTDAAITTRNLLYKKGSDADHIAVAGAGDVPMGTVDDEAAAAEEHVAVKLLGKGPSKRMVASEAIGAGVRVYSAAGGKVATSGTLCVGVSITASTGDGVELEVTDVVPAPLPGVVTSSSASVADSLAIPITNRICLKTTGADAEALTLADGVPGQRLSIVLAVDGGGDGTLTPATCSGFATVVFADAGDIVDFEYVDDTVGWIITGSAGVVAPPVITV